MTCGNMISSKYEAYLKALDGKEIKYISADSTNLTDETPHAKAFKEIGLKRYCCKRHFLTHTNVIDLL